MPIVKNDTEASAREFAAEHYAPIIAGVQEANGTHIELRPQTKEECIKRQGTVQAAMQSPGLVAWAQNYEDYKRLVKDFAEFAIAFVENK